MIIDPLNGHQIRESEWMIRILFTSSRNKWGTTISNRNFGVLFLLWLKVFGGFQMNFSEILPVFNLNGSEIGKIARILVPST